MISQIEVAPGTERFWQVLADMYRMHCRKSKDYGTDGDLYANCRSSEAYGIPAWLGVSIRIGDKEQRVQSFAVKGELANESIEDSLLDSAVYNVIRLVLYRERQTGNTNPESGTQSVGET